MIAPTSTVPPARLSTLFVAPATSSGSGLYPTAAKVAAYVALPFLLIADLVIDGARALTGCVVAMTDPICSCFGSGSAAFQKAYACSNENRAAISEIITTMAQNSKLSLLFNHQTRLHKLGDQVKNVHPLKFLGEVLTNPQLKSYLREILGDSFKRIGLMGGLGPSLSIEWENGTLYPHLNDFARTAGVPAERVRPFFDARNWEGLVRYTAS